MSTPPSSVRRPRHAAARPLAFGILAGLLVITGASRAAEVRDRALIAGAGSPASRAAALERLVATSDDPALLRRALESEDDPTVRERALALAPGRVPPRDVAHLLALRLDRGRVRDPATLVDLRAAGAQGDERGLGVLARFVGDIHAPLRVRLAALTALGAIATRRGLPFERLPRTNLDTTSLGELAQSLDEDAAPWRVGVVRALARRRPLEPRTLERLRARARASLEPGPGDCGGLGGALDLLLLRGDHATLGDLPPQASDRAGLLAPRACLVERPDSRELDRLLALEAWGGRGAWRRLEALASRSGGRAALSAALERAGGVAHPAVVATAVLLAREGDASARALLGGIAPRNDTLGLWARAGLGSPDLHDARTLESVALAGMLDSLPPPLVESSLHHGGARAAAALARALGRADGELAFVPEPGAGDPARAFLTDLAVEAFSTLGARER